jgi:glycerophosphoryl diester phosphodiesterase
MYRLLLLALILLWSCNSEPKSMEEKASDSTISIEGAFDWQGHRGARGLLPENTVPSFLKALEFPKITTLELDLAVSKDSQLIVSHEPWFSHHICSHPDGRAVTEEEEDVLLLYQMTLAQIQTFDCGLRGNTRFPEQQKMPVVKPTLQQVVRMAEGVCAQNNRALPRYNIEIKSRPEWDGTHTPPPARFAKLVLAAVNQLGIHDRTCIQSFDKRALQAVHAQDSTIVTALLIENAEGVEANLAELGYTPEIYSPYYMIVTDNLVKKVHEKGMKIIPWTVNETTSMEGLMAIGVDGIITDYPDRILGK